MAAFFKWLMALVFGLTVVTPPARNYVPDVAAEAAYAALIPDRTPGKKKVATKDCTTCNGTGRVRSGDDQGWTKCPDCEPSPQMQTLLAPGARPANSGVQKP